MQRPTSAIATQMAILLSQIHHTQPLIHNVTNLVTMSLTANVLLALGASPLMAHAGAELDQLVSHAQAIVINLGTLDDSWLTSMLQAMQVAKARGVPIIFDPVGVAASDYRLQAARQLLRAASPQVIRGNASEILRLASAAPTDKGVDSTLESSLAYQAGCHLAEWYQCIVVVSGKQDFVIQSDSYVMLENGHELMTKVTGMGCSATAVIAACCAVCPDHFFASTCGMGFMGIAGELASERARGPGSFATHFLDRLYRLDGAIINHKLRISHEFSTRH